MDKTAVFGTADGGSIPSEGTMIDTLIFDTDGVIVHREMYFSEQLSQEFGMQAEKILPFFRNEFQLCLVGKADLKEEITKYLDTWGWTKSVDELLRYWFESENIIDREILVYIQKLRDRGVRCYLDTNNEKYRTQYLWEELGLKNFFDDLFSSAKLGYAKPQHEFWSAIDSSLKQPKRSDVLVWDDEETHVTAARTFGFSAELYTDFDSFKKRMSGLSLS